MKKILIAILVAVILILSFAGCSGKTPVSADKPLEQIRDEIIADLSIEEAMPIQSDRIIDLYGISAEDIEESGCFVTMSGVFPDEIVMIKASNPEAVERIKSKLETKLQEFMNQAKDYDAESYALAQKCKVEVKGHYVSLFLSAKSEEISSVYNAHFE